MQLEQLYYIVSIAKNGTFSKSAKELHISQSAISQSINRLESSLGVQIFERSNTGVKVTEAGEQLIIIASAIINNIEEFKRTADNLSSKAKNDINIGLVTGMHLHFLAKVIAQLKSEFPFLQINFMEESSLKIAEKIIDGKLDIGIIPLYQETLKFQHLLSFKRFHRIQLYIFVSKDSPFKDHEYITPEELQNQDFVMFNGEYMMWFFNQLNEQYGPLKLMFKSKNNDMVTDTVRNGLAIAIETYTEVRTNQYVKNGEIIAIPLKENINENNHLGIAMLKNNVDSKELVATFKSLERELDDLYQASLKNA